MVQIGKRVVSKSMGGLVTFCLVFATLYALRARNMTYSSSSSRNNNTPEQALIAGANDAVDDANKLDCDNGDKDACRKACKSDGVYGCKIVECFDEGNKDACEDVIDKYQPYCDNGDELSCETIKDARQKIGQITGVIWCIDGISLYPIETLEILFWVGIIVSMMVLVLITQMRGKCKVV